MSIPQVPRFRIAQPHAIERTGIHSAVLGVSILIKRTNQSSSSLAADLFQGIDFSISAPLRSAWGERYARDGQVEPSPTPTSRRNSFSSNGCVQFFASSSHAGILVVSPQIHPRSYIVPHRLLPDARPAGSARPQRSQLRCRFRQ
jgi:hypothetical protein